MTSLSCIGHYYYYFFFSPRCDLFSSPTCTLHLLLLAGLQTSTKSWSWLCRPVWPRDTTCSSPSTTSAASRNRTRVAAVRRWSDILWDFSWYSQSMFHLHTFYSILCWQLLLNAHRQHFLPPDAVAAHPEQRPPADWSVLSAHRLGTTAS